jgi:hypothetical protein
MNWGPVKRIMRTRTGEPIVSADRTSTTTIRKVGLEGRRTPQPAATHHGGADDADNEPAPAGSR